MARAGPTNTVKHLDPKSVVFSLYHPDEIKEMSVVKITVPVSFNALGLPMKGGLYDPAMGPLTDFGDSCSTCRRQFYSCPGHFGHIELPVPVFNPFFVKTLYSILRVSCLECYQIQIPGHLRHLMIAQLQLLDAGCVVEAQELSGKMNAFFETSNSDSLAEAANAAFSKEALRDYVTKVLATSKTLSADEYKNFEVLRSHYLALVKDQFKPHKVCWSCKKPIMKITFVQNKLMIQTAIVVEEGIQIKSNVSCFVTPEEVRKHMRVLWPENTDFILAIAPVLRDIKTEHPTDIFFIDIVPVPPPKVRPVNYIRGKMSEHPQTLVFHQVLEHSIVTRQATHILKGGSEEELGEEGRQLYQTMQGETALEKLHGAWQGLQASVDHLVDSELNNSSRLGSAKAVGLKQVISKKEGLIRMHMMGKRVNYAARTVITPDPNLGVDEIGIPEEFAKVLTYPTPVTPWNVDALRRAVLNGPDVYPGATVVQMEDGSIIRVSSSKAQRASVAKRLLTPTQAGRRSMSPKIVHRHLRNGDVLLLNRQPTLHRPSIMAHRAHVLQGEKTFRMHYANCKSYNADFDGDEMNAHFPQSELGRAEAYYLAQVGHQYLVPKDGTPLSGLIQDHVVSGVQLTVRGRFFARAEYCMLLQQALPMLAGRMHLLPPAMMKPRCLWSGKQVLSTVLLNCIPTGRPPPTLIDSSKIPGRAWGKAKGDRPWQAGGTPLAHDAMSEAEVVIRDGELLCGVLDKKHFGSTPYGLAHCVYELYGGEACMKLLSAFARLFTAFLQREGFTLGVRDILIVPEADSKRREMLDGISSVGPAVVATAFDLTEQTHKGSSNSVQQDQQLPPGAEVQLARIATGDKLLRALLDHSYKQVLDDATNAVSRACVPAGLLEPFPNNNLQLMVQSGAKGSTVNTLQISCLLGQIELEGRRPPLMPSGKALPSFRRFDCTPRAGGFVAGRFLTGILPQEFFFHCMAGREGLIDTAVKTSRSGYLQRCLVKHLEGLVVSYDGTVRDSDGSVVQFAYGEDGLDVLKSRFLTSKQIPVLADNFRAIFDKDEISRLHEEDIDPEIKKACKEVRRWNRKRRRSGVIRIARIQGQFPRTPEPVASRVPPCSSYRALTEKLEDLINSYVKTRSLSSPEDDLIRDALTLKGVHSQIDAGEPVGILAAQSVGEPSTQMTLNTFHFAGRGEMNVTLGIPRLREILMMASRNPKTPTMEVPVRSDISNMKAAADSIRRRLRRSLLSELLQEVNITECLEVHKNSRHRSYRIHILFLPSDSLRSEHSVTPRQALKHVELKFIAQLLTAIRRRLHTSSALLDTAAPKETETAASDENIDDENALNEMNKTQPFDDDDNASSEEEGGEDEDATGARYRARHNETHEYDGSDESDGERANNGLDERIDKIGSQIENEEEVSSFLKKSSSKKLSKRQGEVLQRYKLVTSYKYDEHHERWCEVTLGLPLSFARVDFTTLIREVAEQSVVCETPGIKRAFINENSDGTLLLRTEGSDFSALFPFDQVLDINNIYSNDVHAMAQTYGIEAARAVLVREVRDVFKAYGITVDPRHLLLIADYMTFLGTYEPLSKRGMQAGCSPLQQMSFESSLSFLQTATLHGRRDTLQSPSSRIMLGRPCGVGTGAFSLLQQLAVSG